MTPKSVKEIIPSSKHNENMTLSYNEEVKLLSRQIEEMTFSSQLHEDMILSSQFHEEVRMSSNEEMTLPYNKGRMLLSNVICDGNIIYLLWNFFLK